MESSKQGAAFGGEAVFLQAAVGFFGDGALDEVGGEAVGINADLHRGGDGVIAVDEGVQNGFETTAVQGILGVRARRPASLAKESWRSSKERKRSA